MLRFEQITIYKWKVIAVQRSLSLKIVWAHTLQRKRLVFQNTFDNRIVYVLIQQNIDRRREEY